MGRMRLRFETVRFSIRLTPQLNKALAQWAREEGITKSILIERELGRSVVFSSVRRAKLELLAQIES